ncbi:MAG: GNAT family N-acetyltransferase [Mycobacterium leprae]
MSVRLRPLTPADYPRIVAIQEQHQLPETTTVAEMEAEDRLMTPEIFRYQIAAENGDGLMVGYGLLVGGVLMKPGHSGLSLRVDADWQRQGIGDLLFRDLLREARAHGAQVLDARVREQNPAHRQWAERRGFTVTQHLFESALDLTHFDPSPFAGARSAAESAGIRFVPFAAMPQDDPGLQRFNEFLHAIQEDIPGGAGQPMAPLDLMKRFIAEDPNWEPNGIILAVDGDRWAGIAWVQKQNRGGYYNTVTGVVREYRGRHLATALKLVAIDYARSKGAPHIRTNNDSTNQRMLAVNRKLGYQPLPGVFVLERSLAE